MENSIIKDKQQKILAVSICSLISYQPIVYFVNVVMNYFVGEGFIYDSLLCYTILLVLIIKSLLIIVKQIKNDIFFISVIFLLAYLFTYFFFYNNRHYMFTSIADVMNNPIYVFFVFSFSGYIFIRYITDYRIFTMVLKQFSVTVVIISTITFFLLLKQSVQPQYMVFSYNMLVHTLYLFIDFLEHKKISAGIISFIGILMIFIGGARGPIVVTILTIAFYYFFRKKTLLTKVIGIFTMVLVTGVIYKNFNNIIQILNNLTIKYGINSRTIQKILVNDFFDSSGRDSIYTDLIDSISLIGNGLYGDRAIEGIYAHNIVLEILVQFGYLFGPIIIIVILYFIANGIFSRNNSISSLCAIFISSGFIKLFLTGSYLNQEPAFYILLGLGVNALCERRQYKYENTMVMQHNVT